MNQQPINVDVTKLDTQLCPMCESPYCTEVFQLKHLPALMSPNGQAQVVKVPSGYSCVHCRSAMFGKIKEEEENKSLIDVVK